jgi:hypothetical protein
MSKAQPEYQLQKTLCEYLRIKYPHVLFHSTLSGMNLTMPQAVRNKQIQKDGFAIPDLLVLEARKGFHALFLELKPANPFRQDGRLKKDAHLEKQRNSIRELTDKGFAAFFVWSFEDAKKLIDDYLRG